MMLSTADRQMLGNISEGHDVSISDDIAEFYEDVPVAAAAAAGPAAAAPGAAAAALPRLGAL